MLRTLSVLCLLIVGCQEDPKVVDSSELGAAGGSSVVSVGSVTAQLAPVGGSGISGAVSFDIFESDKSLTADGELRGCMDERDYFTEIFDSKSCSGSLGEPLNGGLRAQDKCFQGKTWINNFHVAELADLTIGKTGGGVDIVGHIAVILDGNDKIVACGVIKRD